MRRARCHRAFPIATCETDWSEGSSANLSYRAPFADFAQTVCCLRSDLHALYFSTPKRAPSESKEPAVASPGSERFTLSA